MSVATQGHLFSEEVETDLPLRDNGVHFYYEEDLVLVLRNHGSTVWFSLWRERKSHCWGPASDNGFATPEEALAASRERAPGREARRLGAIHPLTDELEPHALGHAVGTP